jgi:hypothetical protein
MGILLLQTLDGPKHALAVSSQLAAAQGENSHQVATPWSGQTVQDLWNEYRNIFKFGNRNAASHLWSTFILERSAQMSPEKLELMFSGFCAGTLSCFTSCFLFCAARSFRARQCQKFAHHAPLFTCIHIHMHTYINVCTYIVSGSPVRPNDYNRYLLRLDMVNGKKRTGAMHYCCWPCVCDTQDFIRVDTKTVPTSEGPKQYHFAVLGNPCDHAYKLNEPFVQVSFADMYCACACVCVRCACARALPLPLSLSRALSLAEDAGHLATNPVCSPLAFAKLLLRRKLPRCGA